MSYLHAELFWWLRAIEGPLLLLLLWWVHGIKRDLDRRIETGDTRAESGLQRTREEFVGVVSQRGV